ncbi:threonine/homoserine/homoserine lactone efflux protein [Actinomadura pelletieri DSM 43383]|uniref:Threonine/homoserine/homoserine lactone efflux protein n=1 Tax=Actinomadura pelletieri DSM 43383 TaxID=1120940 RepID=A0A495QSX8_9ACTN|nr:LysE family translocator [Actinomadura pelletieri]RKS76609.1 threonine/homoserine/homoserine lactone efflux protein [Actinomadura pelletieri DSM 43383]
MTNPLLFLLAVLTLVAIPGPNHLYITARSVSEGRRAGIASALGVETGTVVHIAAAAAGLSAVIAASATAFSFLRYAGAAYLVFLAYRTLRGRHEASELELEPRPLRRVYLDGVLVNVLNPKVILFFLAFLPQFVDQDAGAVPLQFVVMGLITALFGLASDIVYAVAAGSIGSWLRSRPVFQRRQRYATGLIYLGLGAAAVFAGPSSRRS